MGPKRILKKGGAGSARTIAAIRALTASVASLPCAAANPGDTTSIEEMEHIASAARQAGFPCEGNEAIFIGTTTHDPKADFYVLTCQAGHRFGYLGCLDR